MQVQTLPLEGPRILRGGCILSRFARKQKKEEIFGIGNYIMTLWRVAAVLFSESCPVTPNFLMVDLDFQG